MAKIGDWYIVELLAPHLGWGVVRYTNTRERIYNEGYIKIPADIARDYEIYNSNGNNGADILGRNLFYCDTADGYLNNVVVKAAGSKCAGDIYAKQFQGNGDLKLIGRWYKYIGAQVGDRIRVTWVNSDRIYLERL